MTYGKDVKGPEKIILFSLAWTIDLVYIR